MYSRKNLPKVDIIIRSKNEEKWINSCINAILNQNYPSNKVKITIVDNNSTDGTISKIKQHKNIKLIKYNPEIFKPGEAINKGAKSGKGEIIVLLSAHCIPVDKNWLLSLILAFRKNTAGVYGKQLPYINSSASDKRDLFNQFGKEKRIQNKENFFHNANSAIKRSIYKKFKFNEIINHIEDRIWAKEVLKDGYNIVYEPKASVFHYHGLNHNNNLSRAEGVAKIIEKINEGNLNLNSALDTHNFFLLISFDEKIDIDVFNNRLSKLTEVFSDFKKISFKFIIINQNKSLNVDFKNKFNFSYEFINFDNFNFVTVINKYSKFLKKQKKTVINKVDGVIMIDLNSIIINKKFYSDAIWKFVSTSYDSIVPAIEDYSMYWQKSGERGDLLRIDSSNEGKAFKNPIFRSIPSLFTISKIELVLENRRVGDYVGCIVIKENEIRSFND